MCFLVDLVHEKIFKKTSTSFDVDLFSWTFHEDMPTGKG